MVFAKEDRGARYDCQGDPLQANNLAERQFNKLIEKAKVRRIKFHGLGHTAATLALLSGVPAKTVQKRLGHKKLEITMDIYAHVLERAQKEAAAMIGSLLHS